jgi:hypothetical protein
MTFLADEVWQAKVLEELLGHLVAYKPVCSFKYPRLSPTAFLADEARQAKVLEELLGHLVSYKQAKRSRERFRSLRRSKQIARHVVQALMQRESDDAKALQELQEGMPDASDSGQWHSPKTANSKAHAPRDDALHLEVEILFTRREELLPRGEYVRHTYVRAYVRIPRYLFVWARVIVVGRGRPEQEARGQGAREARDTRL